jgi:hypothetical protein
LLLSAVGAAAILVPAVSIVAVVVVVVAAALVLPFWTGDFLGICLYLIFDHKLKGLVKFVT